MFFAVFAGPFQRIRHVFVSGSSLGAILLWSLHRLQGATEVCTKLVLSTERWSKRYMWSKPFNNSIRMIWYFLWPIMCWCFLFPPLQSKEIEVGVVSTRVYYGGHAVEKPAHRNSKCAVLHFFETSLQFCKPFQPSKGSCDRHWVNVWRLDTAGRLKSRFSMAGCHRIR